MVTWFAFAECLRRLRWTLPVAALLAAAVVYGWPTLSGMGSDAQGTAALALHIPAFLVTAGMLTAVLEAWPDSAAASAVAAPTRTAPMSKGNEV